MRIHIELWFLLVRRLEIRQPSSSNVLNTCFSLWFVMSTKTIKSVCHCYGAVFSISIQLLNSHFRHEMMRTFEWEKYANDRLQYLQEPNSHRSDFHLSFCWRIRHFAFIKIYFCIYSIKIETLIECECGAKYRMARIKTNWKNKRKEQISCLLSQLCDLVYIYISQNL